MDYLGSLYVHGTDRFGSFAYVTSKRTIHVHDGDTVNIFLSQTAITGYEGVTDVAIIIVYNGVSTWEAYAGDQRRSNIIYTLSSTDNLQIKSAWGGPSINFPAISGMLDPINFSINQTINTIYNAKSQIDATGYLPSIQLE